MKFPQIKLFSIVAASLITTPALSAEFDYFLGGQIGARLDGDIEETINNQKSTHEMYTSAVFGLQGGFVYDDNHRLTFGLDYRGNGEDDTVEDDDRQITTLYSKYDYMLPITNALSWTVGTKLGYQIQDGKDKIKDLNGGLVGVQTGFAYAFKHWEIGTEIAYLHHLEEAKRVGENGDELKINFGDETVLMFTFNYYF